MAQVESSLARNRAELASAIEDLRSSGREATDVRARVDRYTAEARDQLRQQADALVERESDRLTGLALALGFLGGGGVGGTARLPWKVVRVALGRPTSRSLMEVNHMRSDRHTRQLGRALVAVAAADRQLRGRRGRSAGRIVGLLRRLSVIGTAGAGIAYVLSEDEYRDALAKLGDDLLDRVLAA
jgi:hypothetical protein